MPHKLNHLLFTFAFWLMGLTGFAQTFPVTISTQINQPSPIYWSNYADATTSNSPIKIQIVLNDLTISNRQVRIKCYWQGNGISFMNNDFVVGAQPLFLEGGVPLQLTNVNLAPYFEFQNIVGITPNQYAQAIPEGIYTFSVEVYDVATGQKLSRKSNVTAVIFQNEPPLLNLPLNKASIMQQNIQNIVFSWTPRQINVSNVEYQFDLVEIWDQYTPVQNAFAYSPPIYTTTTRATTLQYGVAEPQLIPGKRYAWRIKAKALVGAEEIGVFKNNGYSEIFAFSYDVYCTPPLQIATDGVSQDQAKVTWSGALDNFDYQVNYREKNADSQWYTAVTPREFVTLANLKPNTTYEYTVGAACEKGKYVHSGLQEFTTLAKDEIAFVGCGIKPDPKDLANQNPLPNLLPNDVVTAGDFPIVVIKSSGSNGRFTGEGYVTLPFLEKFRALIDAADALGGEKVNIGQFSRIRITFDNIGINTDFKLISGEIIASYDPNWKSMGDLDGVVKDVFGDAGEVINHDIQFEIATVVKNPDGTITVTGTNGASFVQEKTPNDIIFTDKNGKQYTVAANAPAGPIESSGQVAPGGIPTPKNTNGMGSGGVVAEITSPDVSVVFSKGDGKYAFDTAPTTQNGKLNKTYASLPQKSGGTYNVPFKAISNSPFEKDVIVATVDFKNGKTKKDLVFKTQNGTAIDSTQIIWNGNVATLSLRKTLDFAKETVIATVRPAASKDPKEAAGKYDIAGTFDLWHLSNKKVNVTLVSVNGASIPSDAQTELNKIYEPAGVTFVVNTTNISLDNSWGESIQTSESGLLATYTNEQQQIITNLQQKLGAAYKKDTYYIIYTDAPSDKSNILGFMPLKRQYGFIFNKNNTIRTLAHELGHGVFGLEHPFTEYNTTTTTDLLMDYGTGLALNHNDWQVLHAPGLQLYPFIQGDSDGEFTLPQLTPNWEPFTYKESNTYITFNRSNPTLPNGAVHGISVNNVIYKWDKNNYYAEGSTTPLKIDIIKNPSPELLVQLFWMRDKCGYDERYTAKWSYLSNKKGFNIDDIKVSGQVTFSDRVPCRIDGIDQGNSAAGTNCDGKDIALLNSQKDAVIVLIDNNDVEKITTKINEVDICTIRKLTYEQIEKFILKISSLSDLDEKHEKALLRLMNSIKEEKYQAFFTLLEKDTNKLLKHYIDEFTDHSINPFDGDNYTSLNVMLLNMYQTNPKAWMDLIPAIEQEEYFVDKYFTKSKVNIISSSDLIKGTSEIYEQGFQYNPDNGKIRITHTATAIQAVVGNSSGAYYAPVGVPKIMSTLEVNPLSPVMIDFNDDLQVIEMALNNAGYQKGKEIIIPALFLKFGLDKLNSNTIEKSTLFTLNGLTIVTGLPAIVQGATMAKRLWALAEVAGAAGDIVINTEYVQKNYPRLATATNVFNGAMGVVGLKNLITNSGIRSFATNLPSQVKQAFKDSKEIKSIIAAEYLKWKIAVTEIKNISLAEQELITKQEKIWKAFGVGGDIIYNIDKLLTDYPNISKFIQDIRVKVYFSNNLQLKSFEEILKTANPDVLRWIDKMTEGDIDDFAEMVRGFKDNPEKFKLSIKTIDDFVGTPNRPGFVKFWSLTPKMEEGLTTIRKLKKEGKLLPTGNATEIQLATAQNYTAWGNFLNNPMRYGEHFGAYAERALVHLKEGLAELRKVPERNKVNEIVFSGRAYSQQEFDNLFVGKMGKEVEINKGFVSSSLDENVSIHFAIKTSDKTKNIKVIRRIKTKTGVYLDDLSDYGENLGNIRHSASPPIEQIQKEVLMEEGLFKQVSEPIPFKGTDGNTWYYIDFIELGKPLY